MPEAPGQPAPRKELGQHFLRHEHICHRMGRLLVPTAEDTVVEIGPGPGILTHVLEQLPHRSLILLEKDLRFCTQHQAHAGPGTSCLHMDALAYEWKKLPPGVKIAGNLPYNIASRLIWDIVSEVPLLGRAVFMVQKEVGQRLCATPGTRAYGALSVWVQAHVKPKLEFCIAPGAFYPPPKVESAVISFARAGRPIAPAALKRLLRLSFAERRKQIGGILRRAGIAEVCALLARLEIDPASRPENLDKNQFDKLAAWLPETALFSQADHGRQSAMHPDNL